MLVIGSRSRRAPARRSEQFRWTVHKTRRPVFGKRGQHFQHRSGTVASDLPIAAARRLCEALSVTVTKVARSVTAASTTVDFSHAAVLPAIPLAAWSRNDDCESTSRRERTAVAPAARVLHADHATSHDGSAATYLAFSQAPAVSRTCSRTPSAGSVRGARACREHPERCLWCDFVDHRWAHSGEVRNRVVLLTESDSLERRHRPGDGHNHARVCLDRVRERLLDRSTLSCLGTGER